MKLLTIPMGVALGLFICSVGFASGLAQDLGCREAAEADHYECQLYVGVMNPAVAGQLGCQTRGGPRGPYDCWLPLRLESLPDAEAFVAAGDPDPGVEVLWHTGLLRENLSVFQVVPLLLGYQYREYQPFWVYDSENRNVAFSGTANMPIKILDVDGKPGNEILVRHHVAKYTATRDWYPNSPHLVAYSISETGVVHMMDPLHFPGFREKNREALASLKELFEDNLRYVRRCKKEADPDRSCEYPGQQLEEYFLFQLQLIEYQSRFPM